MPPSNRRGSSKADKIPKKHLDPEKSKVCSKEDEAPAEPPEQRLFCRMFHLFVHLFIRCVFHTFVSIEINAWKCLAPIYLHMQGLGLRNRLFSEDNTNGDNHEISQPLIIIPVDLLIEEAKPSGSNVQGVVDGSDVWANNIPKGDTTTAKQNSKKKGKKKAKRYKKPTHKDVSPVSESQYEEGVCDASLSEILSSDMASSIEHESQKTMEVEEIAIVQEQNKANDTDDIEICNDDVEARASAMDDDRSGSSLDGTDNNSEITSEKAECTSEEFNWEDFQTVTYRKKGRLAKKSSQLYNGLQISVTANSHNQTAKVSHSIWQRVQKKNTEGHIREQKKIDVSRRVDSFIELKNRNANGISCNSETPSGRIADIIASSEITSEALDGRYDVPEKLKRKSMAYKQGHRDFMEGSDIKNSDQPSKNHVQQKGFDKPVLATNKKSYKSVCVQSLPHCKTRIVVGPDSGATEEGTALAKSDSSDHTVTEGQFGTINETKDIFSSLADNKDGKKRGTEIPHADNSKLVGTYVSVLQNQASIRIKDPSDLIPIQTGNSNDSVVNESAGTNENSKNKELQPSDLIPIQTGNSNDSVVNESAGTNENSKNKELQLSTLDSHHPHSYGELNGVPAVSNHCLNLKAKDQSVSSSDPDLIRIVQAVCDSYKLLPSKGEFEKFIHSASPVLDQLVIDSVCPHQTPKISLGNLWQWYEQFGSCGLEVKVKDHYDVKGSRIVLPEFTAYFVPYISAIQLFGRSMNSGNEDLLFEYFESDQPQGRKPFYEKIKELVKAETSSTCELSGDSLILECMNLDDLHHASWYSVAWYPIYRIPRGKFRAAFLTYHSLGHFVQMTSNTSGGFASMSLPVVGLQSYNAKSECWFRARGMDSNDSRIPERLRMLEQTASVMARASVRKGTQRRINRQPDFEFFLSRRW